MTTIALPRQPHSEWLARLRTIGLGLGARGAVGLGLATQAAGGEVTQNFTVTTRASYSSDNNGYTPILYVNVLVFRSVISTSCLSSIAGKTITAASLWILVDSAWWGAGNALLYRVLDGNDWTVSARWNTRKSGTAWLGGASGCDTPGVDHNATVAATGTFPPWQYDWFESPFTVDGIADIQYQVDNAIWNGFVIKCGFSYGWRTTVAPYFRITYH